MSLASCTTSTSLDNQALLSSSSSSTSEVFVLSGGRRKRGRCSPICLVTTASLCCLGIFILLLTLFLLDPSNPWRPQDQLDIISAPLESESVPVVEELSFKAIIFEEKNGWIGAGDESAPKGKVPLMASLPPKANASGGACWEVIDRFDCFPGKDASQQACEARGCCWRPPQEQTRRRKGVQGLGIPYCFYPLGHLSYFLIDYHTSPTGFVGVLQRHNTAKVYPLPVPLLRLEVSLDTATRLHVKLTDHNSPRYESPLPLLPDPPSSKAPLTLYNFSVTADPFSFRVTRKDTNRIVFDTSAGSLSLYDQFLEVSSFLPSRWIYGLGEHVDRFLHSVEYSHFTFFATDQGPRPGRPLYGTQPFYLSLEGDGRANGVFLLNSNAMEVILTPAPAITYRTIGGILDFYFFLGPSPKEVVAQYMELVGRPALPPYWALGFHLCKYGYGSLERTKQVMERNIAAGIPLDTQWNDIDYMASSRDFTYDQDKYNGLPEFVKNLHDRGMHYMIITDPGISGVESAGSYPPFDEGLQLDIFIKNSSDKVLFGQVWTGDLTAYPDFTHPNATPYWTSQVARFHSQVPFDGLWIDMNEPSNFVDGSISGCPESSLEAPPYLPHLTGSSIFWKTICMSAKQHLGLHYDLHNLYGMSEAIATQSALLAVRPNKRPLIISRSTFAGQGQYSGLWSGDDASTWEMLQRSIPNMFSFNMFGMPLVGTDICGFSGNTTEELCQRWQQLGAFYPFARNHNSLGQMDQDPAAFGPDMIASTRLALQIRYRLLPYYYHLFYRATTNGATVVRPLFFQFPLDTTTYEIDWQLLVGSALMVSPVLTQATIDLLAYFPAGRWYDFYNGEEVMGSQHGLREYVRLDAPLDKINLHVFGGSIIPTQTPSQTTTATRKNAFQLLVALDFNGTASGELFWDDGEQFDVLETKNYSLVQFHLKQNILQSKIVVKNYPQVPSIDDVMVFGMGKPHAVLVHDEQVDFKFDAKYNVVVVKSLELDTLAVFRMRFVF